jgi:hypothetical protein
MVHRCFAAPGPRLKEELRDEEQGKVELRVVRVWVTTPKLTSIQIIIYRKRTRKKRERERQGRKIQTLVR